MTKSDITLIDNPHDIARLDDETLKHAAERGQVATDKYGHRRHLNQFALTSQVWSAARALRPRSRTPPASQD